MCSSGRSRRSVLAADPVYDVPYAVESPFLYYITINQHRSHAARPLRGGFVVSAPPVPDYSGSVHFPTRRLTALMSTPAWAIFNSASASI